MATNDTTKKLGDIFEPVFTGVEQASLTSIANGDRSEEDHITGEVFTRFEERVNNQSFHGLRVRTRQFSGRGPNSDESITGADGALILEVPHLELRKFFIFQAKKFKDTKGKFDERAIEQKWRMLAHTPDSFFLIYTPARFYWTSAFMIGLNDKLADLPHKTFSEFHQDFFNCFIGDHSLRFPWFPGPFPRHFYWEFWDEFRGVFKLNEKNPLAKKNLLIQIEQE